MIQAATCATLESAPPRRHRLPIGRELIVDSFAGGGGASHGIEIALGRSPDIAVNHNAEALAMHAANHPDTLHVHEDVWKADLRKLTRNRPVGLLWASPDCRHFSRAKGAKPVSKQVRSLAWIVCKWASQVRPRVIILENVREFAEWGPIVPRWACRDCKWTGTEGQAVLARTRRRCPSCGSARLQETGDLIPCPDRKGLTFRKFTGRLRNLGYNVEWRNLDAADYGAPTRRRRLFLVARRDGEPIVWPEPTHAEPHKINSRNLWGDDRKPWRTAAECIDWTLPTQSIFDRKKPLAEKKLRRIALGIQRYVLESDNPFIVRIGQYGSNGANSHSVDDPLTTVVTKAEHCVVEPFFVGVGGPEFQGKPVTVNAPLGTVIKQNHRAVVTPTFIATHFGNSVGQSTDSPLGTVTQNPHHDIVAPTLVTVGYSEREGQEPRALDIEKPFGTVVSSGGKHALIAAWLIKHFGGQVGAAAESPLPTTTVRGTQNQLAAACLVRFNHGEKQWDSVDAPVGTVTSQGLKFGLVAAFLVKYFGVGLGQPVSDPASTVTTKDRFGLVEVELQPGHSEQAVWIDVDGIGPCILADIGLRMLTPRELAKAQGFPDDYVLTGTKTSQVARIGNSVCPPVAAAMVKANFVPDRVPAVHV